MDRDILIRIDGKAGRITLNRPDNLNALTYNMILDIEQALISWRSDDRVKLVIIDAVGKRAFCAGGDIQDMYETSLTGDYEYGRKFWRDEYRLNAYIANYPKPYIAVMDGIVMGGGVGVSAHGSHRIVTSRTMLAMPECAIGLIPDVGGSYLLAKAPGRVGEFMAATGARLDGADAIYAGFADVIVKPDDLVVIIDELASTGDPKTISKYEIELETDGENEAPICSLVEHKDEIDTYFNHATALESIGFLEACVDEWAIKQSGLIRRACPLSVACSWQMIQQVRNFDRLEEALKLEYRFTSRSMSHGEFLEGTRAQIIDKDRNPKWEIATLEEVTKADILIMLEDLGEKELSFG